MKKVLLSFLSIVFCVSILAGCTNQRFIPLEEGQQAFSFTAEEFQKSFNKNLEDPDLKIGQLETETGDGRNYSWYVYPDSGFSVHFVTEPENGYVTDVIETIEMVEGTDSAQGSRLISLLILSTNKSLDSNSGMQILEELGLTKMDQWKTGYVEETSFDGIVYHVSFDENYLLTLTIFPMPKE